MSDRTVHVVGGGLAGLVAAITAAESGAPVVLHEAVRELGGRALGGTDRPGVNLGPHVVFGDGALARWVRARGLPVPLLPGGPRGVKVLDDRGSRFPLRSALELAGTLRRRPAPVDEGFREWSDAVFGSHASALMCRLAGLYTFHHDPGSLSARFVWDRWRRTFLTPYRVRWVAGGWSTLIGALADRASALGVQVEVEDRLTAATLPDAPVVVATRLPAAARLLARPLRWPGARTALLDVVTGAGAVWPSLVADVRSDLATCCMVERETAFERGLLGEAAAPGAQLFQAHLGIAPEASGEAGVARIEDTLDRAVGGWREATVWRRGHVVADSTGAVDPPGATWRDRPAVDQGEDRFLAGDAVAAPGLLSEVSVNSAVQAARLAVEARRRRVFPSGWPAAELTPDRRLAVLGAVLPAASVESFGVPGHGERWEREPVDQTGPGYRLATRAGVVRATAVTPTSDGAQVTTLVAGRRLGRKGR